MSRLATALPGHAVAGDGFLSLPSVWNAVSLEAGLEVIEVAVSTAFLHCVWYCRGFGGSE